MSDDPTTPKIEVRGLCKAFGRKQVLRDLDLTIRAGESLAVIGGSGTGKSVLIKNIIGLMTPDAGSIRIDGEEVTDMSVAERERVTRKFGMLFQGAALFDSLPVWENVAFGLIQVHGVGRREARAGRRDHGPDALGRQDPQGLVDGQVRRRDPVRAFLKSEGVARRSGGDGMLQASVRRRHADAAPAVVGAGGVAPRARDRHGRK